MHVIEFFFNEFKVGILGTVIKKLQLSGDSSVKPSLQFWNLTIKIPVRFIAWIQIHGI